MLILSMPGGSELILLAMLFPVSPLLLVLAYYLGYRSGRKRGKLDILEARERIEA